MEWLHEEREGNEECFRFWGVRSYDDDTTKKLNNKIKEIREEKCLTWRRYPMTRNTEKNSLVSSTMNGLIYKHMLLEAKFGKLTNTNKSPEIKIFSKYK